MKCVLSVIYFSIVCVGVKCYIRKWNFSMPGREIQNTHYAIDDSEEVGNPLFLTPLIEASQYREAQFLSRVKPDIGNVASYSGYLTTNKMCGNNLFFWFFPAQEDWEGAPLVLWLQGGPGMSSMFGLFEENGPFNHFSDGLKMREYSWNVKNNLLFIDQPVGTGYSFTEKQCYAEDEIAVGENLYSALIQFLQLFPNLQKNKFFVTGESYAGHYIPAIGYTIHLKNPSAKLKINLAGMMIGDGWTDPREQINYGDYLYQIGLIDDNQREEFYAKQNLFIQQVDAENWEGAVIARGDIYSLLDKYTDISPYNYLPQPKDKSDWLDFLQTPTVRKSIHVGNLKFYNEHDTHFTVYYHLSNDIVQSVKPWVEILLDAGYPMVFYVGQVDVICAYPMVVNFLRSLQWSGQAQYLNAARSKWIEGGILAGYIKVSNNMADVLVRGAGHMVPSDQPFLAYQLVNRFTSGGIPALIDDKPLSNE